jgi:HEAT repeat protein
MERIRECVRHQTLSTRLAAVRALAEIGDRGAVKLLSQVARAGEPADRHAAAWALGRLKASEAEPLLSHLVHDPDPGVRRAAVAALGTMSSQAASATLHALQQENDRAIRKELAGALHAGRMTLDASRETALASAPERPQRMEERVRGGAQPLLYISLEAALRELPDRQSYGEAEISRLIGQACIDFASTRRYLVDGGLMTRERGIYQFTEFGAAVWRVERFIREHYGESRP